MYKVSYIFKIKNLNDDVILNNINIFLLLYKKGGYF